MNPTQPPFHLYRGELGDELVVLSKTDTRVAERATQAITLETADGSVRARPGDFIVSMPTLERYPIKPSIYFGTYEILSTVGQWFVGRRLLHRRRAWPVVSAGAEFDYGSDRGRVSAMKGAWIYQSDDDDFGLINETAQSESYTVVCEATELLRHDWDKLFHRLTLAVHLLPPVLTALALAALVVYYEHPILAQVLLVLETTLLLLGLCTTWLIRRARWALRAAVASSFTLASDFQIAVRMLGARVSTAFPAMALWRAAQDDSPGAMQLTPANLRKLKERLDDSYQTLLHEVEHHHAVERYVEVLPWLAAFAVLLCLLLVMTSGQTPLKLAAIWLPSLVGAAHGWAWQRQSSSRVASSAELLKQLGFVRTKLVTWAPNDELEAGESLREECCAALRMLCKSVAQYSQQELRVRVSTETPVPL